MCLWHSKLCEYCTKIEHTNEKIVCLIAQVNAMMMLLMVKPQSLFDILFTFLWLKLVLLIIF